MPADKSEPTSKPDYVCSVCAVVQDEHSSSVAQGIQECLAELEARFRYYELVIVDNAARGRNRDMLAELTRQLPGMRVVRLSRRVGPDIARTAALEHVIGDFVVAIDIMLEPPSVIAPVVDKLVSGTDVVVGHYPKHRGPALRRMAGRAGRKIASRLLNAAIEPNTGSCLGLTRRALNSLTRFRSRSRFLAYDLAAIGYDRGTIEYEQQPRPGWTAPGSFLDTAFGGAHMIVANSMKPLRFASLLGLVASMLNLAYLLYIIVVVLLKRNLVEGWLTTSLTHTVMFFFLFVILSVMAEYVGRILSESRDIPLYFVEQEISSTVSTYDIQRVNVVAGNN